MSAIAFQANPERWTSDGTMRDYIEDPAKYVYWSTPPDEVDQKQVRIGMPALIVRTTSKFGLRAIITVGNVEEAPRELRLGGERDFKFPARLEAAGDDHAGTSTWKTGIRLREVRWEPGGILADKLRGLEEQRLAKGERGRTAFLLGLEDWQRIEAMWENPSGGSSRSR